MAGLRKLKGNFYARICYKDKGKFREKLIPLHTSQRPKAESLLTEIEVSEKAFKAGVITIDKITVGKTPELRPAIDDFLEYLITENRSPKTIGLYRLALNTLEKITVNLSLDLMGYTDFVKAMRVYYPNPVTLNIRLRGVRAFLNWAVENKRLERLPFKIRQFQIKRKEAMYYSNAEMNLILGKAKSDPLLLARIYLHWQTGLRLMEFRSSYLDNGFIKTFNPVKHGDARSIPVSEAVTRFYTQAQTDKRDDHCISKKFHKILISLGLYKTRGGDCRDFHNLRDTFATMTYYQTRDIFRVSRLLGHRSVKTTECYALFDVSLLDRDFGTSEKSASPVDLDTRFRYTVSDTEVTDGEYLPKYAKIYNTAFAN